MRLVLRIAVPAAGAAALLAVAFAVPSAATPAAPSAVASQAAASPTGIPPTISVPGTDGNEQGITVNQPPGVPAQPVAPQTSPSGAPVQQPAPGLTAQQSAQPAAPAAAAAPVAAAPAQGAPRSTGDQGNAPVGGMQTGAGGTADGPGDAIPLLIGGLIVLLAVRLLLWRRIPNRD